MADKKLPLSAHLEELRKRLIYAFVSIGVAFGLSYAFIKPIINFLMAPLVKALPQGSSLIFTAVPEAFFTYLKAALLAGVFFSAPFILYQLWAFISPGLYEREKRYALPYLFVSSFFFLLGAAFCYWVIFPAIFRGPSRIRLPSTFSHHISKTGAGRESITRSSSPFCSSVTTRPSSSL